MSSPPQPAYGKDAEDMMSSQKSLNFSGGSILPGYPHIRKVKMNKYTCRFNKKAEKACVCLNG
jgi:hypothetical protein